MKKSILSLSQRRLLGVLTAFSLFLVANTLYLMIVRQAERWDWAFLNPDDLFLPGFYQGMTLAHTGAGIALMALVLAFVLWHLPNALKRKRRVTVVSGLGTFALCATITFSGFFIMTEAGSRENAWVWQLHVACAAGVIAAYLIHRLRSYAPATMKMAGQFFAVSLAGAVAFLGAHGGLASNYASLKSRTANATEKRIESIGKLELSPFKPAAAPDPENTFFPSLVTTTGGGRNRPTYITRDEYGQEAALKEDLDKDGFVHNTKIGAQLCQRCHPDIVDQWAASAHRFSSFNNPFYEAAFRNLVDLAGKSNPSIEEHLAHYPDRADKISRIKSQWCAGCHDPALLFPGVTLDVGIDRRTAQAQAGLTCLGCHNITAVNGRVGNANYLFENQTEDVYIFSKSANPVLSFLHDTAMKAKPAAHKKQMLKPVFRTAEYCSACHKVNLDQPVNNYRWFRGQDEFDNWQNSGVAHGAARTFYLPPTARQCQACHMPLEPAPKGDIAAKGGMVKSHRFLAVNTALPFIRGDQETIDRIEAFLRDGKLRADFSSIIRTRDGERVELPLDSPASLDLRAGDEIEMRVTVRNQGVGHTFPGGTNDSNEGWIRFEVTDPDGKVVYISGGQNSQGLTDPESRFYRALMVNEHSEPIRRRDAQDIRAAVYANLVGPGTADVGRYGFTVTEDMAREGFAVRAKLLWRKFDREYTQFACDKVPEGFVKFGGECPQLPITEIDKDEWRWADGKFDASDNMKMVEPGMLWQRVNDYGIALLLDGETAGAEKQFARVAELAPDRPDGPRNLARVALNDGSLEKAEAMLLKAEELEPASPQSAWIWALLREKQGRYEDAVAAYARVLAAFPEERGAWSNLGRVHYLLGDWEKGLDALDHVLKIDPESSEAHYTRMLIFRAKGDFEMAAQAKLAYDKYKIDESAKEWTAKYRLKDPGANLMAQQIQVHRLSPNAGSQYGRLKAGLELQFNE